MKMSFWLRDASRGFGILVAILAALTIAHRSSAAPIVTLTLSINDDGTGSYAPGQFAVYAGDSLDNGGIAGLGIALGGTWTSNIVVAPFAVYPKTDGSGAVFEGLDTVYPTGGTSQVILIQDVIAPLPAFDGSEAIYGLGQVAGSLSTVGSSYIVQPNYGVPLLILQGTYSGTVSLVGGDFTNDNTYVFENTLGYPEYADVQETTQVMPEPGSGIILLGSLAAFLSRRLPRKTNR